MPAHPPAVGVAKITMTFLCSGRNFGDSFYISKAAPAPWTNSELISAASGVANAWETHLGPLTSSDCSLVQVSALDLSDSVGRMQFTTPAAVGTITTSPALRLNSVARITFQIPRHYRGGRPSINLSGQVVAQCADERSFTDADADLILNAFQALVTEALLSCPAGAFQCAVSYFVAHAPRLVPLVLPVLGAEIQKRICTLRKRLGKSIVELLG